MSADCKLHSRMGVPFNLHSCIVNVSIVASIISGSFQYNSGAFPSLPSATGLDLEDESGSDNDGDVTMDEEMQRKKVSCPEVVQLLCK